MGTAFSINDNLMTDPEEPALDLGTYDPAAAERFFPADPRPGVTAFTFSLQTGEGYEHQPFEHVEKKKDGLVVGTTLRVNYKATYSFTKRDETTGERTVNFLTVDFWTTPKMKEKGMVSEGAKLLAALGYDVTANGAFTEGNIRAFLTGADGRVTFRAKTGLRYYDKAAQVEYTTSPRKNNAKQTLWPKTETGEWKLAIVNSEGKRVAGNVTMLEFYKAATK